MQYDKSLKISDEHSYLPILLELEIDHKTPRTWTLKNLLQQISFSENKILLGYYYKN